MNNQKMVTSLLRECKQVLDRVSAAEEDPCTGDESEREQPRGEVPVTNTGCKIFNWTELPSIPSLPYFSSPSRQVPKDYWISRT